MSEMPKKEKVIKHEFDIIKVGMLSDTMHLNITRTIIDECK